MVMEMAGGRNFPRVRRQQEMPGANKRLFSHLYVYKSSSLSELSGVSRGEEETVDAKDYTKH